MLYETQMRNKMATAAIKSSGKQRSVIRAVSRAYENNAGVKAVKDWNADLSMPTYRRLVNQGVMA